MLWMLHTCTNTSFTTELTYLDTNPNNLKTHTAPQLTRRIICHWFRTAESGSVWHPSAAFVVWHEQWKTKVSGDISADSGGFSLLPLKAFPTWCLLRMIENQAQIVPGDCSGCYGKRTPFMAGFKTKIISWWGLGVAALFIKPWKEWCRPLRILWEWLRYHIFFF